MHDDRFKKHSTWLTSAAFWVYLGLGIVMTAIMTLVALAVLLKW
jgi:hypothetical protein